MSHNFNFEFDGNEKSAAARAVGLLFGGALILLSAVTSAAFFWEYSPDLFSFISPSLSPYLAAATGVLCFEMAAVAWSWLRAHDADTHGQLTAANVGSWGAMIGGLLVTAVYFILNNRLLAGQLDATAETVVSILGGLLIVLGVGGHFALGHVYRTSGAAHQAAEHGAEIRAMKASAAHTITAESVRATMANTVKRVRETLPDAARNQGGINADRYLAATFDQDQDQNKRPDPADFSLIDWAANGQNGANPTRRPNGRK